MMKRVLWLAWFAAGLSVAGCGTSASSPGGGGAERLVVTADWLNQSLTLLDYDKLIDGESDAASSIVDTIDLSDWEPGPIEVELTPDGKSAVVSVGPAFFDGDGVVNMLIGSPEVPPGGALLIVDLESGEAIQVPTQYVPLGIAINAEGTLAYVADYGTVDEPGNKLLIVDIPRTSVMQQISLGGRPEQVALSPDGTLGVINIAGANGGIHVFETTDVAGTLSPLVSTGNDPSDVTFLADETRVAVANSFSQDVTLVDTTDPRAPEVLGNYAIEGGFPYGVTYMASRNQILAPTGTGSNLVTLDVEGDTLVPSAPEPLPGGAFPLTAAVDDTDSFAFVGHVSDNKLSIIDVETGESRAIEWLTEPGPSYVAVQP